MIFINFVTNLHLNIVLAFKEHKFLLKCDEQLLKSGLDSHRLKHRLLVFIVDYRRGCNKICEVTGSCNRLCGKSHFFGKGRVIIFKVCKTGFYLHNQGVTHIVVLDYGIFLFCCATDYHKARFEIKGIYFNSGNALKYYRKITLGILYHVHDLCKCSDAIHILLGGILNSQVLLGNEYYFGVVNGCCRGKRLQ